ncbi:MAG: DUF5692 family protein [Ruthenibacterium lactatiformans]
MTCELRVYLQQPAHPRVVLRLALLLAPTFANALWNKGGWIQNRANTLALWCMFAQVFPLFQDASVFTTIPVLYADGFMDAAVRPLPPTTMQGVVAILALAANVIVLAVIIKRSPHKRKPPYGRDLHRYAGFPACHGKSRGQITNTAHPAQYTGLFAAPFSERTTV